MMVDANVGAALVAMFGAALFMMMGYINEYAKNKTEACKLEFKTGYAMLTLLTMLSVGAVYEQAEIVELTFFVAIQALLVGMGGNAGISKVVSMVGNLNEVSAHPAVIEMEAKLVEEKK